MTTEEMIKIMQAYVDGIMLQSKRKTRFPDHPDDDWQDCDGDLEPDWDWFNFNYRIKPELNEIWVNLFDGGGFGNCHKTKKEAEQALDRDTVNGITKRFKEVEQ